MTKYYLSHYHLFSLNQLSLDASLNWLVSVVPNILRLESLELYVVLLIQSISFYHLSLMVTVIFVIRIFSLKLNPTEIYTQGGMNETRKLRVL